MGVEERARISINARRDGDNKGGQKRVSFSLLDSIPQPHAGLVLGQDIAVAVLVPVVLGRGHGECVGESALLSCQARKLDLESTGHPLQCVGCKGMERLLQKVSSEGVHDFHHIWTRACSLRCKR